jgi:hypothetical protein
MRLGRREAVGNGLAGDGSAGRSGAGTCGWPDFDGSGWNQIVLEAQGLEHGGYSNEIPSSLEKSSSDDFDHRFEFRG